MGSFYQSHLYQHFFSLISTIIKTARRNCQGKKFEPEVTALTNLIKPQSVCLDVGGAYGRYAFPLSRMVGPKGKVYSFEPGSYSYTVFWWIKFLFGLSNVVLNKKAVSNKPGQIQLCLPLKESGKLGASLAYIQPQTEANVYSETVEMITLDDFSQQQNLSRVDLIKCDTEGSELFVFQGASKIIKKFNPIILTEIDEGNMSRYKLRVSDILNFFLPLRYRLVIWDGHSFVAKSSIEGAGNYFFIPEHTKL